MKVKNRFRPTTPVQARLAGEVLEHTGRWLHIRLSNPKLLVWIPAEFCSVIEPRAEAANLPEQDTGGLF